MMEIPVRNDELGTSTLSISSVGLSMDFVITEVLAITEVVITEVKFNVPYGHYVGTWRSSSL